MSTSSARSVASMTGMPPSTTNATGTPIPRPSPHRHRHANTSGLGGATVPSAYCRPAKACLVLRGRGDGIIVQAPHPGFDELPSLIRPVPEQWPHPGRCGRLHRCYGIRGSLVDHRTAGPATGSGDRPRRPICACQPWRRARVSSSRNSESPTEHIQLTRTFTVTVHREPRLGDLIEATPAQGSPAASRSSPISVFIFVSLAPTSATRVLDPDERVGGPTGGTDGVLRVPQRGSSRPQKSTSPDWSACPWRCGGQLTILCPGTSGTRKGFAVVRIAGILHGYLP